MVDRTRTLSHISEFSCSGTAQAFRFAASLLLVSWFFCLRLSGLHCGTSLVGTVGSCPAPCLHQQIPRLWRCWLASRSTNWCRQSKLFWQNWRRIKWLGECACRPPWWVFTRKTEADMGCQPWKFMHLVRTFVQWAGALPQPRTRCALKMTPRAPLQLSQRS